VPANNGFIRNLKKTAKTVIAKIAELCVSQVAPGNFANSQVSQIALSLLYKDRLAQGLPLAAFDDVEFRVFSQNGEDGILWYIFSLIGTTNKKSVEICAGNGTQCNTANLIVNHGWRGLLCDGDEEAVRQGKTFFGKCKDTSLWPPAFAHSWITVENVNDLIREYGFDGEIDLLSLDMDGVDYWIFKALTCINPRVIVLEYNNLWGPDRAVTVPYQPDFRAEYAEFGLSYGGASLAAFEKLASQKGYRLVGCQRYGYNAFFIRNGLAEDIFPGTPVSKCLDQPFAQLAQKNRLPNVINRPWVDV
jgi:hypothetical protein